MQLSDKFKGLRQTQGLTQQEMAKRVGITYQQWQKYEYGKAIPNATLLIKLKKAFPVLDLNSFLEV